MKVFVVWAKESEQTKSKPIYVDLESEGADAFVLRGLMQAVGGHLGDLEPGGQLSLLVTRGRNPSESEPDPTGTFASFVIDNPETEEHGADKHVWEFAVERREATVPVP